MSFCCYSLQCINSKSTFGEKSSCIYIVMMVLTKPKKHHSIDSSKNTPRDACADNSFSVKSVIRRFIATMLSLPFDAGPPTLGAGTRGVELDRPGGQSWAMRGGYAQGERVSSMGICSTKRFFIWRAT